MQFTKRQRSSSGKWRPLLAAIALGLLLGFIGPFGSYPAFPRPTRYAFWLGLTLAGAVAAMGAESVLPRRKLRPGFVRMAAGALMSGVPMTFVVAWAMSLVQPGRFFNPQQLPALFVAVSAVQLLIVYAMTHASPATDRTPASPLPVTDARAATFPAAILKKLPATIGSDIIALETEDHYLRVHTVSGSALVLMRMADAVAMLDSTLGTQVHRRWWVAENAVAGLRSDGQKLSLKLVDGRNVPVGRTFAAAARARFGQARRNTAI